MGRKDAAHSLQRSQSNGFHSLGVDVTHLVDVLSEQMHVVASRQILELSLGFVIRSAIADDEVIDSNRRVIGHVPAQEIDLVLDQEHGTDRHRQVLASSSGKLFAETDMLRCAWLARLPLGHSSTVEFCFLICSERSGSNLITRLMDGHSRVCGPSPTHLFRILLEYRSWYGDLGGPENWQVVLSDAVALWESKLGVWSCSSISVEELEENVDRGSLAGLFRYVYEKEAESSNKRILFVKENHFFRHFAFVDRFFPDSKFVFLVRDPRDMALSWKLAPNLRGCVIRAAETWKADQVAGLALYHALAGTGRIVGVRYEDLVGKTSESLEKVCALLAIEFEEAMTHQDARPANWANADAGQEWANLHKPVIRNNFQKYPGVLSPEEVRFIEGTCAHEMRALGYPLDHAERPSLPSLRSAI